MTRQDALRECQRLSREHPDRAAYFWAPRPKPGGDWTVVGFPALRRSRMRGAGRFRAPFPLAENVAPPLGAANLNS